MTGTICGGTALIIASIPEQIAIPTEVSEKVAFEKIEEELPDL